MSLLSKIQKRLKSPEAKPSGDSKGNVSSLDKLPDHEKIKVLDYLKAVKDLHKAHESGHK